MYIVSNGANSRYDPLRRSVGSTKYFGSSKLTELSQWFFATGVFNLDGKHADSVPLTQPWFLQNGTFNVLGVHDDAASLV